jgi:hypothetical protein
MQTRAHVVTEYLKALQAKLNALQSGEAAVIEGADAVSLLFPPGGSEGGLDRRAAAIIRAFGDGYDCDYDYEADAGKLRFIRR